MFCFVFLGSQERKLQRRCVRSRSESERGNDLVPKKKTKKEQVLVLHRESVCHTFLSLSFFIDFYSIIK